MCGIFIIIRKNKAEISYNSILNSFTTLEKRGSDFQKITFFDTNFNELNSFNPDFKMAMGSSRFMTFNDNPDSNMPFYSKELNKYIVFNGDLYNYLSLRKDLKNKYSFTTKSDTEVLLNTVDNFKYNSHDKMNGDYAYAIFDKSNLNLDISIDRFTSKPLFKFENKDFFVLSSEIKAIFKLNVIKDSLQKHFVDNYIQSNFWLFNQKGSIEAYTQIEQLVGNKYYNYNLKNNVLKSVKQLYSLNKLKTKDDAKEVIIDSIKLRSKSDRNVGVLISGGIDSSTITNNLSNQDDINFFYTDTNDSDSYYTKYLINKLGIKANKVPYSSLDLLNTIKDLNNKYFIPAPIYGESIGMYSLYKNINNSFGSHIMLTGHGGDEIFGGKFLFINSLETVYREKGIFGLLKYLNKIKIPSDQYRGLIQLFINKVLFIKGHNRIYNGKKMRDLKERQLFELNFANVRQSGIINDINGIHNNIAARAPLMDYRLMDIINFKFKDKVLFDKDRIILREMLEKKLPKLSLRQDKQGMRVDMYNNFMNSLPQVKEEMMEIKSNYLSKKYIIKELSKKKLDKPKILRMYSLICYENCIKNI